jgi:hypothetical protein
MSRSPANRRTAACDRCGGDFPFLDLVRVQAGVRWTPRRLDVCASCAEEVRRQVSVTRTVVVIATLLLAVLIFALLALSFSGGL